MWDGAVAFFKSGGKMSGDAFMEVFAKTLEDAGNIINEIGQDIGEEFGAAFQDPLGKNFDPANFEMKLSDEAGDTLKKHTRALEKLGMDAFNDKILGLGSSEAAREATIIKETIDEAMKAIDPDWMDKSEWAEQQRAIREATEAQMEPLQTIADNSEKWVRYEPPAKFN